ncbi:prenylcysteine oxidase 1 [Gopherus evgoodei]|uniref:Prenylcysteine oxidase 1 n=1 Tax=Gopherus evgoodei TaxID=1825980 RepID=A0A8C4W2X6_9SAUR|nr:prenylcysteine oxidase 1 [Gopherus evgoodei]XP_030407803.1 prenylcysteine oxidase 1 [Gopherus evgoodei]
MGSWRPGSLPGASMRARLPAPLLLLLASLWRGASGASELRYPPSKIAVIGAGIGGTSAAYFLRQTFGKDVQIDVFEKGTVGGRLATINVEGKDYEAGGSIIHPLNLHMKHFIKELGLSVPENRHGLLGIYNGDEFVFEESSWYIINILKLLWHYGFSPLRMNMWVEDILDKFMRIYRYQSHDYSFSSMEGLFHALGGNDFIQMLNRTLDETLQKAGFSQKFIYEMVTPIMRVNYGQGVNINGFVGAVSMTGADSGLWSVKGGNKLVCSGLLYASKAQLISGTVISIEERTRPQRTGGTVKLYEVSYNSASGPATDMYDIVLIATPLNHKMSNITFQNFNPPLAQFSDRYHQMVATFVHGRINASFFGYKDPSHFHLANIFTIENPNLFIYSIGVVSPVQNTHDDMKQPMGPAVWKVFSKESLTKEQMNLLFSSYDSVKEKKWLAYPHYHLPNTCPPIILHDRIYYLNGIEWAASAMEMSAVAAKNAALLSYHRWYGNMNMIDQEDLYEKLKTEL